MVLSDSFTTAIFKQSFQKMFEKDAEGHLKMGFNGTLAVQVMMRDLWTLGDLNFIQLLLTYLTYTHSCITLANHRRQPRN